VFAEFERAIMQERVRAGLARARSEGKRLGRPRIAPELEKRIMKALATPGRPGVRVIDASVSIRSRHQVELDHGRMHVRRAKKRHAIRPSYPGR
jgi:DNA invertase Pin-like site-specific DNA recombinase